MRYKEMRKINFDYRKMVTVDEVYKDILNSAKALVTSAFNQAVIYEENTQDFTAVYMDEDEANALTECVYNAIEGIMYDYTKGLKVHEVTPVYTDIDENDNEIEIREKPIAMATFQG